jgi:hypothetical protein
VDVDEAGGAMTGGMEDSMMEASMEAKEASMETEASSITEATKGEVNNMAVEDTEDGETAGSGHQPTPEEELTEISDSKQAARCRLHLSIFPFFSILVLLHYSLLFLYMHTSYH